MVEFCDTKGKRNHHHKLLVGIWMLKSLLARAQDEVRSMVETTQNSIIPLEAEKSQENRFTLSETPEGTDTTYTLTLVNLILEF